MEDEKPSDYFNNKLETGIFYDVYPFTMLGNLVFVQQSPVHHPEGSVWNHTMLVVDGAAKDRKKSRDSQVFMWAALLHDLGKATTTAVRKGRITSYNHDREGEILARKFLEEFTDDQDFIRKVSKLVRWHMQILFVVKDLPFAHVEKMVSEVPISEIALLSLNDRIGRGGMTEDKIKKELENVSIFINKCSKYCH